MNEKFVLNKLSRPSLILFTLLLYSVFLCHTFSMAQDNPLNNKGYQVKVLKKIKSLLVSKYVLPEAAKRYGREFKKKYKSGCYESYTDAGEFAAQVTADLRSITKDQHVHFRPIESSDMNENPQSALHHPVRYHRLGIKENEGFSKLEWMDGNVGYLDIRRFYTYSDCRERVIAAMRFMENADAIIIDLRENGGGSGDYLSSYFLNHPTQLNSWYSREDDSLTEFWTIKDIGMEPLIEVPLFLLTSKRTFSASESFAFDMKVRERATIIGDSTRGGAHSVDLYKIDDQFEIYIPTARAVNPVTGGNWEGTGVIPDILVPSESALDTAVVLAKKAGAEFARASEIKLKHAVEEMQMHLDQSENFFRENKKSDAEKALDSMFQIADSLDLVNNFFIDVLAYNYFSPEHEQILYAIFRRKIAFFPKSPGGYESLAYAFYKNNKKESAIENFKKVLKLDPDNRNARKMIQRLE